MKYLLLPTILFFTPATLYAMDHSGQTGGLGYSTSNVKNIDSSLVVTFVNNAKLACQTKDKSKFFNIFSYKVNHELFRDKVDRNKRYGISSHTGEKLERYMSSLCKGFSDISAIGYKVNFFSNPTMYNYGILDFKKKLDSKSEEPVWFTRLCVYKEGLCTLSLRAVVEKGVLRIDEH